MICGPRLIMWIIIEESTCTMIKLAFSNYSIWKFEIEDLCYCKDLFDPIKSWATKPYKKSDDDLEKIHRKTVGTIW